jgi:cobalt-zinc-cadmium efflux system membrane fusion protein
MNQTSKHISILMVLIIIVAMALASWWLLNTPDNDHSAQHDDHDHGAHEEEMDKGPHGGRLLSSDDFALEITIFETGVPPEFHVYPYQASTPVSPRDVAVTIELARIDGQIDKFSFSPQADYLRGKGVVTEPHSFDVTIKASYQGKSHQWQYENYEGRTQIANTMAKETGIQTEKAGPAIIRETLTLTGRIQTDPNRLSHVRARYPGVVKSIKRELGESVRAGDILATVQSNESLQTYAIKAPIGGMIVQRDIQIGEATGDQPLFIITDLSQVWIELDVFGHDLGRVRTGQAVSVETLAGQQVEGKIDWISPLAAHASQSVRARMILANPQGQFRAGQFVRGQVTIAEHPVALAVRQSAIQQFRDFQVVFARFDDFYEVRMLELGRRDREWVEVLHGLKPGSEYVTQNSYLIKADIEKSGASHDH